MSGRLLRRVSTLALLLLAFLLSWAAASAATGEELPTAEALVARSIAYHDPDGRFATQSHRLVFSETRPDGSERHAEALIDIPGERYEVLRSWDRTWHARLDGSTCEVTLDGRAAETLSDDERKEHRVHCDRAQMMRNYYVYLWGLPMKLRDPGTRLGEVEVASFENKTVLALHVTYDEAVGIDRWIFYFDPDNAAIVGCRFYRAGPSKDGEFITFEGELEAAGLRLPKSRAWFMNADRRYLGTDTLTAIETP